MSSPYWPLGLKNAELQRNSPIIRFAILGTMDVIAWLAAWALAAPLLAELGEIHLIFELAVLSAVAQLGVGSLFALYRNRFLLGSGAELRRLGLTGLMVFAVVWLVAAVAKGHEPVAYFVLAFVLALLIEISGRQFLRVVVDYDRRPRAGARVVILGAGEVGTAMIRQMLHDRASGYVPVALLDDDRAKRHMRIEGVPVKGTTAQLRAVIDEVDADGVVVAIAAADGDFFSELMVQTTDSDVWVRTVPSLSEIMSDAVGLASLRDLNVEDLIGRQASVTESREVRELIHGRRIIVTGAGGSIGSELVRRIYHENPEVVYMVDHDESALHALQLSIHGRALMDSSELVLADIRDGDRLKELFTQLRPDIVFHAAALKHLPMLERFPVEAWKTNVHGTLNVLRAAQAADVDHFINISTDKAANPSNMLGRSKLIAERLTAEFAVLTRKPYVSVRFGNVLGSRGSVLVSFEDQIRTGRPVTITHPDVTRYFMTIPEACQLVLQATVEGQPGETLVLDMGEPVKVVDIARRMMLLAGRKCPIAYTGLREGEKLHEELFTAAEKHGVRGNEKIYNIRVEPIHLRAVPSAGASEGSITAFFDIEPADSEAEAAVA